MNPWEATLWSPAKAGKMELSLSRVCRLKYHIIIVVMLTDAKNEIQIVDYRGPTQSVHNLFGKTIVL